MADNSARISRRTLLKVGVAGGVALVLARWLYTQTSEPKVNDPKFSALDASARSVVAAIVPVMLEGALPEGPTTKAHSQCVEEEDALSGVQSRRNTWRTYAAPLPVLPTPAPRVSFHILQQTSAGKAAGR